MNARAKRVHPTSQNEPIHLLVMGNFPYPHGMAGTKRIQQFIEKFCQEGHQVQVVLIRQGEGPATVKPLNGGIHKKGTYKGVPFRNIGSDLKLDFAFPVKVFRYLHEGFRVLWNYRNKKRKVLLYYGVLNLDNFVLIPFAKWMRFKVVFDVVEDVQFSGLDVSLKRKTNLLFTKKLDKLNLLWSDGLIVISRHLEAKYAEINKWKKKIVRIPISASIDDSRCTHKKNDIPTLIYAGSYSPKDGVDNLIAATRTIAQKVKIRLQLVGTGNRLSQYQEKYGHLDELEFLGYLDDNTYYQKLHDADIMCVPRIDSDYARAGFPYKLGEFLATGNPVICSATGDVQEYLKNGENAILVKPGDLNELAEAILYLIENTEEALNLGLRGQMVCESSFNPDSNSGRLVNFIESLIEQQ